MPDRPVNLIGSDGASLTPGPSAPEPDAKPEPQIGSVSPLPPRVHPLLVINQIDEKVGRVGTSQVYIRERMFMVTLSIGPNVYRAMMTRDEMERTKQGFEQALL